MNMDTHFPTLAGVLALAFADADAEAGGGSDDFADSLGEDYPEAVVFESEGEQLIGTVEGFAHGPPNQYQPNGYPIVNIRDEATGEIRSVHCFHLTLARQMRSANPEVGDRIGVAYRGERENNAGTFTYKDFRVKIDRPEGTRFSDVAGALDEPAGAPETDAELSEPEDDLPF